MMAMGLASTPPVNSVTPWAESDTISELVSLLRSAFRLAEFEKVEEILIAREEKLKRNLGEMSAELESWKKEYRLMESEKGEFEDELRKCKLECEELREQVSRCEEDQRVQRERGKRAEERYAKLLEDFFKVENDKREVVLQLRAKCTDLECVDAEKRRAKAEAESWKKKFGELEFRVSRLEKEIPMLLSSAPLLQKRIKGDPGAERSVFHKKEAGGSDNAQNEDTPNSASPQINECASNCHEEDNMAGAPVTGSNGLRATGRYPIGRGCDAERLIGNHSVFDVGSPNRVMISSRGVNGGPEAGAIIEIADSDDEEPAVNRAPCDSNICASGIILSEKESSQRFVKGGLSGQTSEENCLLASTRKRKLASCSQSEDDDDHKTLIGDFVKKQHQGLTHEEWNSNVSPFLATPYSVSGGVAKAVSSSKQSLADITKQCRSKFGVQQYLSCPVKKIGRVQIDSSDSEDTSSSWGDEACNDICMENAIGNLRGEGGNKIWAFESDMLSDFVRDPELCMKAVCALYRRQTSTEKSIKGYSLYKNRGFSQCDALRGTALAKFLVDGDPLCKLKKSISELKQHDPRGFDDCRKLAAKHSRQLFEIYQKKEDPFFLPS